MMRVSSFYVFTVQYSTPTTVANKYRYSLLVLGSCYLKEVTGAPVSSSGTPCTSYSQN